MKYKIIPIDEVAMRLEAGSAEDAMEAFAMNMDMDMSKYFKAIPLDPDRRCGNCKNRMWESYDIIECCMWYEMTTTEEEEIEEASMCGKYEKGTPECCLEDEHYCPSATAGDYSPSNPWAAPGNSIHDFI